MVLKISNANPKGALTLNNLIYFCSMLWRVQKQLIKFLLKRNPKKKCIVIVHIT